MLNKKEDTFAFNGKTYTVADIVKEKDDYIRLEAVDCYFALKELVTDRSQMIRTAVARKNVGHEKLAHDSNWYVRATVAQYCQDEEILKILVNDENDYVRFMVAKRGYGLEYLINDCDEEIASIARYQLQNQMLQVA